MNWSKKGTQKNFYFEKSKLKFFGEKEQSWEQRLDGKGLNSINGPEREIETVDYRGYKIKQCKKIRKKFESKFLFNIFVKKN